MREVGIIQLGLGNVGRELVRQLVHPVVAERLATRYGLRLHYLALADSQGIQAAPDDSNSWAVATALMKSDDFPVPATLPASRWTELLPAQPCVVVDTTAADGQAEALIQAVVAGHRVVLANKRPLTASLGHFAHLTARGATRYEATVGAGLPVISTLHSLLDSGDALLRVEACLSGTLGYLCSQLDAGEPFSAAVKQAQALGYTEPDPRDDLDGGDVARKALILGRSAGFAWADAPVDATPLFPATFADLTVDAFLHALPQLDAEYEQLMQRAEAEREALRYVATITPDGAEVGLRALPYQHPLASLRGPDNLVALTTARYHAQPLVVRGPGAGAAVTAAGVLGDIVAHAREL
jgi:homoserine dehydrogenase